MGAPGYLVIGHVSKDLVGDGYEIGGTVAYAALTAARLGERVAVVTSAGPDIDLAAALPGVALACRPSPKTTTFHNRYVGNQRRQMVRAVASAITYEDIPLPWRQAAIVHLAPIVGELSTALARNFQAATLGITPQGWLRYWNESGEVRPRKWAAAVLPYASAVILSEEDLGDNGDTLADYVALARVLVVTRGTAGATVYYRGTGRLFPAFPAALVEDPTGAGDVFAAAYFISLHRTGDPYAAARFANGAASFAVEGHGTSSIPTLGQVEQRLRLAG